MSLSQEMYTRIYRLYKRNINIHNIATTLNIPLRTVQSVVSRFETITQEEEKSENSIVNPESSLSAQEHANSSADGFLDIYYYQRTRYTIIQFVGHLTSHFCENIDRELDKSLKSNWKAVALRLNDVTMIDQKVADLILIYYGKFNTLSKYFAILDPAVEIESLLKKYLIEGKIPVFGTERAFEDNAFSKKTNFTKRI